MSDRSELPFAAEPEAKPAAGPALDLSQFYLDGEFIHWPRRPTLMTACSLYLFSSMVVFVVRLLSSTGKGLMGQWHGAVVLSISVLLQLFVLCVPVLRYNREHPGVDNALRLRLPGAGTVFSVVAAALCASLISNDLGTLWTVVLQSVGARVDGAARSVAGNPAAIASALFSMALVPALSEELVFRGAILGAWERRGTVHAWVLSSVLFALLHGSLLGMPVQLLMGFVLGYLVITTDSLYQGMLFHFVHNAALIGLSFVPQMRIEVLAGEPLYYSLGGAAGLTLIVLRLLIALAVLLVLLIAASSEREQKGRPFSRPGPVDRNPLPWRETIVLAGGIVTALVLLALDVLQTLRVI